MKIFSSAPSGLKKSISFNPWFFFIIFLLSNILISYSRVSLSAKLWIGLLGVLLPVVIGLNIPIDERSSRSFLVFSKQESLPPPFWLWVLFFFLLSLTRFYRLTSLPFWLLSDEGVTGILGMSQMHQWHWNLLWSEVRYEPFVIWTLGLYFKVVEPSLFSIRLYSAILSILTAFTAYWGARFFLPKWASFLFCWLFTFSFWQFSISRFCFPGAWMTFFQLFCLGLLGLLLKSKDVVSQWRYLFFLSFFAGLGFYTWTNWFTVWLCLETVLVLFFLTSNSRKKVFPLIFTLISIFVATPMVLARLSPGGSVHILQTLNLSLSKTEILLSYLTGIFWDSSESFPFGSNWGGFLNPILSSLIFIGFIIFFKKASKTHLIVLVTSLFYSFLPGALASDLELYRIIPMFPILTMLAVLGLLSLIPQDFKAKSIAMISIFLFSLLGLNSYNYVGHYSDIRLSRPNRQWRTVEYADAYHILKNLSANTGPLYVFSEFNADYSNKSLDIACYPFDLLQNSSLSKTPNTWAAVIVNPEYAPFFIQNFRGLRFKVLKTDKHGPNDPRPFGIFLIPLSQIPSHDLARWIRADQIYRTLNIQAANKNPIDSWRLFSDTLSIEKDQVLGSRLLASFYWEKLAFFTFLSGDFKTAAQFYQEAIEQGYPVAQFYYNMGVSLKAMGKTRDGEIDIRKAMRLSIFNKI